MPRPTRTQCKIDGCDNVRHVYPGGLKSAYCQQHMRLRKSRTRDGLPSMTGPMLAVLRYLRESQRRDLLWVELPYPPVDHRTVTALLERGWIVENVTSEDTRYKMTFAGQDALKVYLPRRNRGDKICPRCNNNPRHVRSSGKRDSYCKTCGSAIAAEKRAAGRKNGRLDRPCSRCRKRPRHQYPGGKYSTYCQHCDRVHRRQNNRKQQRRLFKQVVAGEIAIPPCALCKQSPRVLHPNCLSKYCHACKRRREERAKYKRVLRQKGVRL